MHILEFHWLSYVISLDFIGCLTRFSVVASGKSSDNGVSFIVKIMKKEYRKSICRMLRSLTEPRHSKTYCRGLQPGRIHTSLHSYRSKLESRNVGFRNETRNTTFFIKRPTKATVSSLRGCAADLRILFG